MPPAGHTTPLDLPRTLERDSRHGFVLLTTLVAIFVLMLLVTMTQARAVSNQRLAARLTRELTDSLAHDAIYDRLRGLVADQMAAEIPRRDRPEMNGTPFTLNQAGANWQISVQDQAALIDPYLSDPDTLSRVLPNADEVIRRRESLLASGTRLPRLEMTMARIGVSPQLSKWFSQNGTSSQIMRQYMPDELGILLEPFSLESHTQVQVQNVSVSWGNPPRFDRAQK